MQILEVKNDMAKITYNPSENKLLPADFLLIEDSNQKLIAQIINIETTDSADKNSAILRLALSIDRDDNLSYFNGYIPSKSSKLIYITSEEIIELVKGNDSNIYFGNLSNHPSCYVKTNMSFIDDKLYIQSDRSDKTEIAVRNLVSELTGKNKKIIIIDFTGQYSAASNALKLKISDNMKLPLNIEAFDTILQYDTVDCPIEDKAVIQSIVLELREYLKTLKDKYIPFNMFKQVVDDEFASNPVSGLMLLRNKLWLYAQDSIFADKKEQFDVINSLLSKRDIIIVDASDMDEKWYKYIIQTVASLTDCSCYLFLSLNDIDIDKKSILNLYNKQNIIPVVSTSYDSPYRQILKSLCKNQLLCKPSVALNEQEHYTPLLNRMNNGDIILYGETTLYLPLLLELQLFDSETSEDVAQNEIKRDVDKLLSSPQTVIPKTNNVITEKEPVLPLVQEEEDGFFAPEEDEPQQEPLKTENGNSPDDEFMDSDFDFLDEVASSSNEDDDILNVPFELSYLNQNASEPMLAGHNYGVFDPLASSQSSPAENKAGNIVKVPDKITHENDVILQEPEQEEDLSDIFDELPSVNEEESESTEEIAAIDDVIDDITNKIEENSTEEQPHEVESADDFVVELEEDDILENHEKSEPENKPSPVVESIPPQINENIAPREPQKIPVYETDMPENNSMTDGPFCKGDKVYHPKYGKGVIEEFSAYSDKILFAHIMFESEGIGRRILDPRVSGLEKVS